MEFYKKISTQVRRSSIVRYKSDQVPVIKDSTLFGP